MSYDNEKVKNKASPIINSKMVEDSIIIKKWSNLRPLLINHPSL